MLAGLGGMEQRCPGDGRGLMDARTTVALSGVMVTSTTRLARLVQGLFLKMGSRKTEAATLGAGTLLHPQGYAGPVVSLVRRLGGLLRPSVFTRWCSVRTLALFYRARPSSMY